MGDFSFCFGAVVVGFENHGCDLKDTILPRFGQARSAWTFWLRVWLEPNGERNGKKLKQIDM